MNQLILAVTLIILALPSPVIAQDEHGSSHDHSQHASEPELIITPIVPPMLKSDEKNDVILFIQDIQASPVDVSQFEVVHTQPVHLLIIEPGLNDYHHEHPTQKVQGQYAFSFNPRTSCSYRIWADVQLKGSYQHYIPFDLEGAEDCERQLDKTISLEASSQGYDFKLELEGELKAGEAVFANMSISKDGKPIDVLEPVMGAFAHMVGFYEDYETIAHIHPMGEEPSETTDRGGPSLRFHIEPEKEGFLKLFAQVQLDGKQIYAPFGVLVD